MLRGVRERLNRRRRTRQPPTPPPTPTPPPPPKPLQPLRRPPTAPPEKPPDPSQKQPRVFRNRSLDSAARHLPGPRLLRLPAKALRSFHRTARPSSASSAGPPPDLATPSDTGPPISPDRPLLPVPPDKTASAPGEGLRIPNEDSFSSLPSTHASRDPFLNDDVPIDIARVEGREDRPRRDSARRGEPDDAPFPRPPAVVGLPLPFETARSSTDQNSPPASFSSSSTFRKRSSLWKRTYDPDNEFQSPHERAILKAVALSEAAVKERSVFSAQQLARIVAMQVVELDTALGDLNEKIHHARDVASSLPSSRDARFAKLLYSPVVSATPDAAVGKAEAERVFRELQWTERVWDVEAMVAEKRYEACVASVEKLEGDDIMASASPRTQAKFQTILQQLVEEMSACCTQRGGEAASVFAPLLAKVGKEDHARNVVLDSSAAELLSELQALVAHGADVTPRTVAAILDRTLALFKRTYTVYSKISSTGSQSSSFFVAWIVEQSDLVYSKFVSPILTKMRKADPVTILATIEAARYRRVQHTKLSEQNAESLVALLETRMTTHIRADLDIPIRDAERQLIDRARMYASAIPRNWKEGPYQSGKALCDELNVLCKGLHGALMNLGTDTDILTGTLLGRLALEYSTALLDMGVKAVSEDQRLTTSTMQEGVFETFLTIGRTLLRLHQKYPQIPFLEKVSGLLTSHNLGQVRVLLAEVSARRAPSPSVRGPRRKFVHEASPTTNHLLIPPRQNALVMRGRHLEAETPT